MKTLSDFPGAFPAWRLWDYNHNIPENNHPIYSPVKIGISSAHIIRRLQLHYRRKYNTVGYFTYSQWLSIVEYYCHGYICLHCKKPAFLIPDHIISAKMGGSNFITNIQPICNSCNTKKHSRYVDYRPDRGNYSMILLNLS